MSKQKIFNLIKATPTPELVAMRDRMQAGLTDEDVIARGAQHLIDRTHNRFNVEERFEEGTRRLITYVTAELITRGRMN